ncbi:MAG TPA: hypothetical protein VJT50_15215 [Pyrinomonadaceae bacterium]|nr:hypothetical protein [Pyrinomonadaceae bacterium]
MKKTFKFLLFVVLLLLSTSAFAQVEDVHVTSPGPGELVGSNYSNGFFGLHLSLPQNWIVQSSEKTRQVTDDTRKTIEGDQKKLQQLDDSVNRSITLIAMTKLAVGSPDNASFMLIAERIGSPGIRTPIDVIHSLEKAFEGTNFNLQKIGEIETRKISGAEFGAVTFKTTTPAVTVIQKIYITVKNGYALELFFTYLNENDLPTFDSILNTIKIQ